MGHRFIRSARRPRALVAITLGWLAAALLYFAMDAAALYPALFILATLPALYEAAANRTASLTLTDAALTWQTGRRTGHVARTEIAKIRLDTRLDLSVRMSVVTHAGQRIRLPAECTPPTDEVLAMLETAGLDVERHHFALM